MKTSPKYVNNKNWFKLIHKHENVWSEEELKEPVFYDFTERRSTRNCLNASDLGNTPWCCTSCTTASWTWQTCQNQSLWAFLPWSFTLLQQTLSSQNHVAAQQLQFSQKKAKTYLEKQVQVSVRTRWGAACVASWGPEVQFGQRGLYCWAFLEPSWEAQSSSGRGSKRGSRQSGGRAAENNGFRFLVMSHLEALLFLSKKRKTETREFTVTVCGDGLLCGEFTCRYGLDIHWAYWFFFFFLCLTSLPTTPPRLWLMKTVEVWWSDQCGVTQENGCWWADLLYNSDWKKLAVLNRCGVVPQKSKYMNQHCWETWPAEQSRLKQVVQKALILT